MLGLHFEPVEDFEMPPNSLLCGTDLDGSKIYTGISHYEGDDMPCKIVPKRKEAYISYNGREIRVTDFRVLVEKSYQWVESDGDVPEGAVAAGCTQDAETLYIGRTIIRECTVVHPSHRCLYVPFDGREVRKQSYEVLVYV